jgi:hypothetical protein
MGKIGASLERKDYTTTVLASFYKAIIQILFNTNCTKAA